MSFWILRGATAPHLATLGAGSSAPVSLFGDGGTATETSSVDVDATGEDEARDVEGTGEFGGEFEEFELAEVEDDPNW